MKLSTFHHLLYHLDTATLSEITDLQDLSEQYPYCSLYKILMAKVAKENDGLDYREMLQSAALRSPDRKHLKKVLDEKNITAFYNNNTITDNNNNIEWAAEDKIADQRNIVHQECRKNSNNPLNLLTTQQRKDPEEQLEDLNTDDAEGIAEQIHGYLEEYLRVKAQYDETQQMPEVKPAEEKSSITESEEKLVEQKIMTDRDHLLREQEDLIDRFIANGPSVRRPVSPTQESPKAVDLAEYSTRMSTELYTENLARIMERQGNLSEAKKIYKALIWKFPDKKAYFVNCIEKLHNLRK